MIQALFDETRRKEIRGAILSGRPIPFRSKETKTMPVGKETVIDYASDDMRMRITPSECRNDMMRATIILESMYAESD